jgi:hypothetical protein
MDDNLKTLIDTCPFTVEYGEFEQESFASPSAPGYARYVIDLINRFRKIESDLDHEPKSFERSQLIEEKDKILSILRKQDPEKLKNAVNNWQQFEAEYWADTLGKIAAIEILSHGKATYETMMKMAKLPEDLYIKATQICVKLANTIKDATVKAEEEIGVTSQVLDFQYENSNATAPTKKLLLKKVK